MAGWDLSLSYCDGFKATPEFRRSSFTIAPGVEIPRLTPVFTRVKVPGFDWSTTFGTLEFHGEGAFRFVADHGRDDRFQGIAGVNYTWDGLGLRWLDAVTAIFEYAREVVVATRDRTIMEGNLVLGNAFQDALVGRVEFKLTEAGRLPGDDPARAHPRKRRRLRALPHPDPVRRRRRGPGVTGPAPDAPISHAFRDHCASAPPSMRSSLPVM